MRLRPEYQCTQRFWIHLTTLLTLGHCPRIYSHRRHLFLHLLEYLFKLLSAIHTYDPNGGGPKDWLDDCRPRLWLRKGRGALFKAGNAGRSCNRRGWRHGCL